MDSLEKHTPTVLLKMLNDTKNEHEKLKSEVISDTEKIDEIEKNINLKLKKINELENNYVSIIEEINKRKP